MAELEFWQTKTLEQMTDSEWELICDGCGKCCLNKFIADDGLPDDIAHQATDHIANHEEMVYTNIACHLLNDKTCSCSKYFERTKIVPDCIKLTRDNLDDIFFMPPSCSYRRMHEGRGLPSWHPLRHKGKKSAMHKAGMSVRGKIIKDNEVSFDDFEDYIVVWPLTDID